MTAEIVAVGRTPFILGRIWPCAAVALVAAAIPLGSGITTGLIIGVVVLVVHRIPSLTSLSSRLVVIAGGALLTAGSALWALDDGLTTASTTGALYALVFLGTQVLSFIVLSWAIHRIGLRLLLISYGFGAYANLTLLYRIPPTDFKFALSIPIVLVVAGTLYRYPAILTSAFLCLAVVGMASGARSYAAFLVAATILWITARVLPAPRTHRRPYARYLLVGAFGVAIGVVIYELGTELLLSGAFGAYNQVRTATQLEQTGNLITSARPEWFATFNLMRDHIWGFGPGAVPDTGTLFTALDGLATIHFQGGDYVTGYMFGGHYELHSVIADLWVSFGVVGLGIGLTLFAYLLYRLLDEVTLGQPKPLQLFLMLSAAWYMLFGPLLANTPFVVLTLVVLLASPRGTRRVSPPAEKRASADISTQTGVADHAAA